MSFNQSDTALLDAISEILPDLQAQDIQVVVHGSKDQQVPDGMTNLELSIREASDQPLPAEFRKNIRKNTKMGHSAIYIFTSGTTGTVLSLLMQASLRTLNPPSSRITF